MYKDFKYDSWNDFNAILSRKKLFLFGAEGSKKIINDMEKYGNPWKIEGVLDNSSKKWGSYIGKQQVPVLNPNALKNYDLEEVVVLICSRYMGAIATQLNDMGIKHYYAEFWLYDDRKIFYEQTIEDSIVEEINALLQDDKSKYVFQSIVQKRKDGFLDYSDINEFAKSEYFIDDFWKPLENGEEVFIDGGAYTGDTIEEFIDWTKGNYKHIYSFEPQKDKAEQIKKNLWKYNGKVSFFDKGLWSCETKLSFQDGDTEFSGKIVDHIDNNNYIETVALDETVKEKVTFIKMDIEGAEVEAIKGAKDIILRDKPKLAICIYHKPSDLYEIPRLIHEMVPEYKLYMRHSGLRVFGTIIYAML